MFNAIQFSHAEDYAQLRYIMAFSWKQHFCISEYIPNHISRSNSMWCYKKRCIRDLRYLCFNQKAVCNDNIQTHFSSSLDNIII